MTLKQKLTLKNLPKNNNNIAKSMQESGYSKSSSYSGTVRRPIRDYISKMDFFDPEKIKKDIAQTRRMAKKAKDITNLNRIDEHRSKIAGMITEKREVDNKNPEKTILVYSNKPLPTEKPAAPDESNAKDSDSKEIEKPISDEV